MFDYRLEINEGKCNGCGTCAEVCPILAIDFDPVRKKAFVNDITQCLICKQCLDVCTTGAIIMKGGYWQNDIKTE